MSNIGTNAARIRANLGLSRYDLQQRTGLDCSYLARVERGEITPLTKNVKRLADGLGVNVEDLMQPTPDAASKWLDVQKDEPRVPCVILGNNGCYILFVYFRFSNSSVFLPAFVKFHKFFVKFLFFITKCCRLFKFLCSYGFFFFGSEGFYFFLSFFKVLWRCICRHSFL